MSLVVAVLAEQPSGSTGGSAPWGEWGLHPLSDPATLAADPAVRSEQTRHVLVLTPAGGAPQAQVAAATVAALRPELPVRVVAHPVSATVLARAVELVAPTVRSATAVHASIASTLGSLTWGAWLPSVTKLASPAPTVGQHVQSWFSGRDGFLAVHGDPGWVARLPVAELAPERRLRRVPAPGVVGAYECHAYGELPESAVAALFAMGVTTRPTRRPPIADPAPAWGTSAAVELVVSWPDAAELPAPDGSCPTCTEPVWGRACPFCRVVVDTTSPSPVRSVATGGAR